MKIGLFTISFNDLTVPVSGIPITVTRTYDSSPAGATMANVPPGRDFLRFLTPPMNRWAIGENPSGIENPYL